jgi:hypothetical protein
MTKSKYKLFFDFTKEELWLSKMSEDGYALISVSSFGKYTFQKIEPRKYNYRIDYRVFSRTNDFQDYSSLFEDSGWKHLWGRKNSGSQYFVQLKDNASNDIFSDSASKAGRYRRFYSMWLSLLMTFFPIFVAILMTNQYNITAFTNPKALYYTPGLWDMSGVGFWKAFLFETPFAVGRGFIWLLFLAVLLFYFGSFLRAFLLYRRYLKNLNG